MYLIRAHYIYPFEWPFKIKNFDNWSRWEKYMSYQWNTKVGMAFRRILDYFFNLHVHIIPTFRCFQLCAEFRSEKANILLTRKRKYQ